MTGLLLIRGLGSGLWLIRLPLYSGLRLYEWLVDAGRLVVEERNEQYRQTRPHEPKSALAKSKPRTFDGPKGKSGIFVHQEYSVLSNHVILILKKMT